jgi:GxxExxY protein
MNASFAMTQPHSGGLRAAPDDARRPELCSGGRQRDFVSRKGAKKKKGRKVLGNVELLAREAIDCGLQVHKRVGPGCFESVYEILLTEGLARRGFSVERQKSINVEIDGIKIADAFRADLLVERKLLIELKSVERAQPIHAKQLLTYLRLTGLPLGLLMNFGEDTFRAGLKRVVNTLSGLPSSSNLRVKPGPTDAFEPDNIL